MSFVHMHFYGRTTAPWHVGKIIGRRREGNYLYTRTDILWGRGIRGAVLRQLWRSYCPKSDLREASPFRPEKDCMNCISIRECPFNNLRGSGDCEFKDKPKMVVTNLKFTSKFNTILLNLSPMDNHNRSVIRGVAPVFVECIPPGVGFEFEIILMGIGAEFKHDVRRAVDVSLRFFGWGGLCNEGYGRGTIENYVKEHNLDQFEEHYLKPTAERLVGATGARFHIVPILLIENEQGGFYGSIMEDKFREHLINSINERYWQFYGRHIYVPIHQVSGRARGMRITGWSRKANRHVGFSGIGNELEILFGSLGSEEAKAMALAKYGIGRFKNQGFGSLELKEVWKQCSLQPN